MTSFLTTDEHGSTLTKKKFLFVLVCGFSLPPIATILFTWPLVDSPDFGGFVMVEQVKSIDFRARGAKRIGRAAPAVLDEVLSILDACIY